MYSVEDTGIESCVPVKFSVDQKIHNRKTYKPDCNTILPQDPNSTVLVSMREEEWEDNVSNTKTSWPTSGYTTTWTAGDQVGIFMQAASGPNSLIDRNNIQYNIQTGSVSSSSLVPNSSPIYFPNPSSQNVNFFAYYPYSASNSSLTMSYTLPANQTTALALSSADIMNATTTNANGASPNIALAFNHRMTLLSFAINTVLLSGTLNTVTVSGTAISNTGTLNLNTSALTVNTSPTFSPYKTVGQTISPTTYTYVDIIINPCTLTNNTNGSQLMVSLQFGGLLGTHTTNLNLSSFTFAPGTRYIYNLTVTLNV